jgi:hypothetical protein
MVTRGGVTVKAFGVRIRRAAIQGASKLNEQWRRTASAAAS